MPVVRASSLASRYPNYAPPRTRLYQCVGALPFADRASARIARSVRRSMRAPGVGALCSVPDPQPREASELEHAAALEVDQAAERGGVFRVEQSNQACGPQTLGLYALSVVPRAPNLCALRRVSSNVERA